MHPVVTTHVLAEDMVQRAQQVANLRGFPRQLGKNGADEHRQAQAPELRRGAVLLRRMSSSKRQVRGRQGAMRRGGQ